MFLCKCQLLDHSLTHFLIVQDSDVQATFIEGILRITWPRGAVQRTPTISIPVTTPISIDPAPSPSMAESSAVDAE